LVFAGDRPLRGSQFASAPPREHRLKGHDPVLRGLQSDDFLQAISLLVTQARRREAITAGTVAEVALADTLEQIRALRRQRQEIFQAEDEIMEKRDQLVVALERRLVQRPEAETLFTIRRSVV